MTSAAPDATPPLSPLGIPSPTAASPSSATAASASWAVKKMRYVVESPPPSDSPGVVSALTDVAHLLRRSASTAAASGTTAVATPATPTAAAVADEPTLYNTASTRRSLRTAMEARTLARAASVLSAADDVSASLSALTTDVAAMASLVDDLSHRLAGARSGAAGVVATTSALRDAATEHERCASASAAFVATFVLPPEEDAKLEAGVVDAGYLDALRRLEGLHSRSRVLLRAGATGRAALGTLEMAATRREAAYEAVYRAVQARCGELSTDGDGDGDGNGMEDGQDGWAKGGGRTGGDGRGGGGRRGSQLETTALVRSAVAALRARPRLLRLCADEVAAARRAALVGRFLRALTKGGPGGVPRPIELHAHDVLRYTNDMLAWVHQALAGEKELIGRLFGDGEEEEGNDGSTNADGEQWRGDGGDGGGEDGDGSTTDRGGGARPRSLSNTVLHSIIDSLCRPLRTRLDALLDPPPPVVTTYRLASLISFYATTLTVHLRPPSALVETLTAAQTATLGVFFASWRERLDAFVADTPPPSSADLSPPPAVSATMRRLGDILATLDASLASEAERDASAAQVLDAILTPLRRICVDAAAGAHGGGGSAGGGGGGGRRRASDILGGTRGVRGRGGGVSATERCVYLANCVDAMRTPLEGYPFTSAVVASLDAEAEGYLDEYVRLASEEVLHAVGLADRVATARSWLAADASSDADSTDGGSAAPSPAAVPLCERPGMDVESLALGVRHFYALLFTAGGGRGGVGGGGDAALEPPAVGLMVNVRARHRVKGAVAAAVADAHALLVAAVVGRGEGERGATAARLAPSTGYPPEVGVAVGFRATDKVATVLTGRL
ncbi:hypothetical protein MMPV_006833 [Pyropia vietnamensis]